MVKRKNHEVGRSFLGAWKNANKKLWMFDIKKQALEEGPVDAGFAIQDFLYVPHVGDERDDSTEEWFSDAENYLALLLQRIERRDFTKPISQLELFKVLMGLVGLSYRSSYDLHKVMKILNENSEIQQSLGQNYADEKGRHIFAVENMINQITNQAKMFSLGSLSIIYGIKDWIVAHTKEELEQIRNQITLEKVKEREEKDSFTYQPLTEEERAAGWSLKKK